MIDPRAVPWTPFDPSWKSWESLSPDQKQALTGDSEALYLLYELRNSSRRSPLDFALQWNAVAKDVPHIRFVSDRIRDLVENRLYVPGHPDPARNVLMTFPPRHGKSFLVSENTVPWYLSRYPDDPTILTSYEGDFAAQWGKKSRDLFSRVSGHYGLSVDPKSEANSRWNLLPPYRGGMQTAGTGGPITGKGGPLIIGDDWVKNAEDARSQTFRDGAWDWVLSTFLTRRQPSDDDPSRGMKTLLLMTLWNEDDPASRLLREQPGEWYHIDLPAVAREDDVLGRAPGDALWPDRFSADELEKIRLTLGPYWWGALYQGRPSPSGSGLYTDSSFRLWRAPSDSSYNERGSYARTFVLMSPDGTLRYLPKDDCFHFVTCDLAVKEKTASDFTVFSAWAWSRDGGDLLLTAQVRARMESVDHLRALEEFCQRLSDQGMRPRLVGIEDVTYGTSLIQAAVRSGKLPIREVRADNDKYTRAIPTSNLGRGGHLYLPRDAEFTSEFIHEHLTFPTGTHDDQVDTSSYAGILVETLLRGSRLRDDGDLPGGARPGSIEDRLLRYVDRRVRERGGGRRQL